MIAMDPAGSARVSRAGDGVLAIADFSLAPRPAQRDSFPTKECFGETPKPTRETRALPDQITDACGN
jgi:hypothetical protein